MDEYNIYPKQFRNVKIPVEKNTCFFLMPFSSDFDYIYGTIKKDLNDYGMICQRVDEISGSTPIINKIITEIIRSQYVIVDLSSYNPNVFYELGIAHTFKDARNILLIKQKEDRVPFDITHLTYIEYEADNLKFLTATIKKFIAGNKHISDFYDALNLCGIINIVDENSNHYIEYLQRQLGANLTVAIDLLNKSFDEVDENSVEKLLDAYTLIIYQSLKNRQLEIISDILRIYYELIALASNYTVTDKYVHSFLDSDFHPYGVQEKELLAWKTDFVVLMASRKKKMYIILSWIIEYFTRTKSATIDLNRHKLESFLLTSTFEEVNETIINSLHNSNCYIREHMADIVGEKHLIKSLPMLYAQLKIEDNFFTAASIIAAIGKMGDSNGITHINKWVEDNTKEIYETKQFFVLRRALMAITALDTTAEMVYINQFQHEHGKALKNYFII